MKSDDENVKQYFERRTKRKMSNYLIDHMVNALNNNGMEIFMYALDVTLDRNEITEFETPSDLVRYLYAVCRNRKISTEWEDIEE